MGFSFHFDKINFEIFLTLVFSSYFLALYGLMLSLDIFLNLADVDFVY